jgi:molybdenum cofactor cytidylyltransferase
MPDPIATIIPAAGASRRLGRPKQLMERGGESFLRHAARRALEARLGGPVIVVLGFERERLAGELAGLGCQTVLITGWTEGMAASIRAGVAAAAADPSTAAALIVLVDQWRLSATDLTVLADAWRRSASPMAAAEYADGAPGVPAVFARSMYDQLTALRGDAGARHLLRGAAADEVVRVPMPHAESDFDEPHDDPGEQVDLPD